MAAGGTKVAVLGGGVGALTAAFALTEAERHGFGSYDITVYQLGWRLGGKIADGRNEAAGQRIEEHGLHVWAGFYDNAFTIMRLVFDALPEDCRTTFKTVQDAFKRQNYCYFTELDFDQSLPWPYWFEPDADAASFPGRASLTDDATLPSFVDILSRILGFIEENHQYYAQHWGGDSTAESEPAKIEAAFGLHGIELFFDTWITAGTAVDYVARMANVGSNKLLLIAMRLLEYLQAHNYQLVDSAQLRWIEQLIIDVLTQYRAGLKATLENTDLTAQARRTATIGDVTVRVVLGILKHDCFRQGFAVLDALDLRTFMEDDLPGANGTDSAILTAGYDYVFGFRQGDPLQPALSACSAVQAFFRLNAVYRGAFFYKAMSGMGDTVCTPMFEALRARGVKFEFFHDVTSLEPTADGTKIGTIRVARQADLADGVAVYDPLVQVGDIGAWPSVPRWEQLRDGAALRDAGVDFENRYSTHWNTATTPVELQLERDFDCVVLGISVGALRDICQPLLIEASNPARAQRWTDMVTRIATVRTQALQLWLNNPVTSMGGAYVEPFHGPGIEPGEGRAPETLGPICTGGKKPFDTYADMSHVLPTEAWPGSAPGSVAYFCTTLADAAAPDQQEQAASAVRANAVAWMTSWLHTYWPNIGQGAGFDWNALYAPAGVIGEDRLNHQYWRANINPSDRYVLSLPGTLQYRMHQDAADPQGSGYANLYLAGDWTRVDDVNAGCVEAAAMSGIAAAKGLSKAPFKIVSLESLFKFGAGAASAAASPQPAPQAAQPDYLYTAGSLSLPPVPSVGRNAEVYCFAFPADVRKCQAFIDAGHNLAGRPGQFRAFLPRVFLTIVKTPDLTDADPAYANLGTMAETDIGFWLLVGEYGEGTVLPKRLFWMPAYLFVDNAYAMASGREIYGFPKYFAAMKLPQAPHAGGPFEVSALAYRTHGPGVLARTEQVLRLSCNEPAHCAAPRRLLETIVNLSNVAGVALMDQVLRHLRAPFEGGQAGLPVPVLYLKQFRAANSATKACYRELLTGPLTLTKLRESRLLTGNWQLELQDLASLPFIEDLGLGTATNGTLVLSTGAGVWADIDFELGPAGPL